MKRLVTIGAVVALAVLAVLALGRRSGARQAADGGTIRYNGAQRHGPLEGRARLLREPRGAGRADGAFPQARGQSPRLARHPQLRDVLGAAAARLRRQGLQPARDGRGRHGRTVRDPPRRGPGRDGARPPSRLLAHRSSARFEVRCRARHRPIPILDRGLARLL